MSRPRIAIPLPTSFDPEYNERAWPQYAQAVERAGGQPVSVPLDQTPAETARLLASCSAILLPGSGADVNPQKYGAPPDPLSAPPDHARENVDELLLQDAHNMGKPIFAICFGTQMLNVWRGGTLIQDLPTQQPASPVNHKAGRTVLEAHPVEIAPDSLLACIVGDPAGSGLSSAANPARDQSANASELGAPPAPISLAVNSSHHQAIATPGDGLRVTARSPQDGVIEAIEGGLGASSPVNPHRSDPGPVRSSASDSPGPTDPPPGISSAAIRSRPAPFILGVQWHPERTYDSSPASRALFGRFLAEARAWSPR